MKDSGFYIEIEGEKYPISKELFEHIHSFHNRELKFIYGRIDHDTVWTRNFKNSNANGEKPNGIS